MLPQIRAAAIALLTLSLITGVAYPLLVSGIAKAAFPAQAAGSLIEKDGHVIGSKLLGQPFDDQKYFWGRLSGTSPAPYNASAGVGSNLGPTNPALADAVKTRIQALRSADAPNTLPIPVDLVTASASGLDPHISPAAALYQAQRVARARTIDVARVRNLIDEHTEQPGLGFLGEPRVHVLELNLAIDGIR